MPDFRLYCATLVLSTLLLLSACQSGSAAKTVTLYVDGAAVTDFDVAALDGLAQTTFNDTEAGVTQRGWLLNDVLHHLLPDTEIVAETTITVKSSSRSSSATVSGAEVSELENYVLLALTQRGTLRLASMLEALDERSEWVADVDTIEVQQP